MKSEADLNAEVQDLTEARMEANAEGFKMIRQVVYFEPSLDPSNFKLGKVVVVDKLVNY